MLAQHIDLIEKWAFNIGLLAVFFFIAMAINDVLKKSSVPRWGKAVVWGVLFAGCAGFVAKGLIQLFWTKLGLG